MRAYGLCTLSRALRWVMLLVALVSAGAALGETASYRLLLDTDNDPATGCAVPGPAGSLVGIEQVATTVVDTTSTGATVTRLERQTCSNGVLGAPVPYEAGGWNVGFGNGIGGSAVVETSIPLAFLPPG